MQVPQVSPWIGEEEASAVADVVRSNWITEGAKAREFSARLNSLFEVDYGVFAPNGTMALFLGLLALGIGGGDSVLIPDTTFIASATAVILAGARPIFVDVAPGTYQIDVGKCRKAITSRTAAIMPVHLYGASPDMVEVTRFATMRGLSVIEDAAEAVGVYYDMKHAGTWGDVGCFSFFADKTITTGEGGYVVCRDAEMYERLLRLRNQGRLTSGSFVHPEIGYNFCITDLQAVIGLVQLSKLPTIIKSKSAILERYEEGLWRVDEVSFLEVEPGSTHVPFRVVIFCPDAPALSQHLEENGVRPRSFFYPLHRQPCFEYMGLSDDDFPNAVYGYEHGLCLPVFPTMTQQQVDYVCEQIKGFYA